MRIHTNLTWQQMHDLPKMSGAPIYYNHITEHASRTHARSFEVRLGGSSNSRTNAGNRGAGDETAATWDEWGAFFGALYAGDETARCGGTAKRPVYAGAEHYHFETGDRFRGRDVSTPDDARWTFLPADTHPRHSWDYGDEWFTCRKCGAERPSVGASETYRASLIGA